MNSGSDEPKKTTSVLSQTSATSVSDKLAKFGEPEQPRAPRRFDTPQTTDQQGTDPRIRSITDSVKELVIAHQAKGGRFEVESRTDVNRFLRVAHIQEEELLLINTDVYIPGRWFIRRQWRRLGEEPGDEFFTKSATARKGSR